ncbi:diguanylate cyclase [Halomonas denitrificans]|nr:diguanylate cyclase [Halomonas denitrificans]
MLLVLALGPGPANARTDPSPTAPLDVTDISPPSFESFTGKDGLSEEIWSTVGFDADGFAWAGSASALAWFDGYRWHDAEFDAARSLVRDLARTPDGTLWAIFEREGLASFDGHRWALSGIEGYHYGFSSYRRPDGQTVHYVGQNDRVLRWVGGEWRLDPGRIPGPPGRAIGIARTETLFGEPREWLAVAPGRLLWRPADEEGADWRRHPTDEFGLDLALFTDLVRSDDRGREELWVLTYGSGIARLTEGGIDRWRAADGSLPTEAIYSAVPTRDANGRRTLWIASRAGLLQLTGDALQVHGRSDGLPSNAVRSVTLQPDQDGSPVLWMATEGGVVRTHLQPSPWQVVSRLGEADNGIFGVLLDADDRGRQRVWFGSARDGLVRLSAEGETRWPAATGKGLLRGITALFQLDLDPSAPDRMLISTDAGALIEILPDDRFVALDAPFLDAGTPAISALVRQGPEGPEAWFGTRGGGLWRWRNDRWKQVASPRPPVNLWGLTEQVTDDGSTFLWMASDRGIARWDGRSLDFLAASVEAADGGYRDLELVRHDGGLELWASSLRQGVVRFAVDDPATMVRIEDNAIPPPPDPTVYSVLQDSAGRIYVCTNNGVQLLMPTTSGRYAERVFRRSDGLVHDECNTGSQAVDAFDRYWVGTLAGLGVFDPALAVRIGAVQRHPLVLTGASADGTAVALRGADRIRVPAGTRRLSVDYVQRTNRRESESRYRSELVGYDPAPLEWTSEAGRRFGRLPPGEHRLVVQARDFADVEAKPLELTVAVEPLWWQRTVVRSAAALLIVALAAIGVMAYNRSLRHRQDQLQRQVDKRTAELNALNTRLTELSYRDPLTGLANRRSLTADAFEILEDAARRGAPVGVALLDIDGFKPYNDRHGHLAGDSALQVVAQLLREGVRSGDRVARFGGEEFVCLLPGADADATKRIADNLRTEIQRRTPEALGTSGVTISAGIVSAIPKGADALPGLLHRADLALYEAKRAGRNRVVDSDR